jgi:hypothetical protein
MIDQVLTFRVSRHLRRQYDPLAVHAGPSYLMAVRAGALPAFAQHRWLRFVELTAGYGARQTSPGQRAPSWGEQKRRLYVGVSLDLSDWLRRRR